MKKISYIHNKKKNTIININFYLLSKKSILKLSLFLKKWFICVFNIKVNFIKISVKEKKQFFSIRRSPHVFKKSQQQYFSRFYLLKCSINLKNCEYNFLIVNKMLLYVLTRIDILFLKIYIL